jgi:hypothetical protein
MFTEFFDAAYNSLDEAIFEMIRAALIGALLLWGAFIGKVGTWFVDSRIKILYVAASYVLVAVFFAFWSFKWATIPDETRAEAFHDAALTFYYVLITLWGGCIWGAFCWEWGHDTQKEQNTKTNTI